MNISLPVQMQAFLEAEVEAGTYATTSEAVRDGIRLLQERRAERDARLGQLRHAVAVGIGQADRSETSELDVAAIKREGRASRNAS